MRSAAIAATLVSALALGDVLFKNQGVAQGPVNIINCSGFGATCDRSGDTGNIRISFDGGFGSPVQSCDAGVTNYSHGVFISPGAACTGVPACLAKCWTCGAGEFLTSVSGTTGVCSVPPGTFSPTYAGAGVSGYLTNVAGKLVADAGLHDTSVEDSTFDGTLHVGNGLQCDNSSGIAFTDGVNPDTFLYRLVSGGPLDYSGSMLVEGQFNLGAGEFISDAGVEANLVTSQLGFIMSKSSGGGLLLENGASDWVLRKTNYADNQSLEVTLGTSKLTAWDFATGDMYADAGVWVKGRVNIGAAGLTTDGGVVLWSGIRPSNDPGTTGYFFTSAGGAPNTWTSPIFPKFSTMAGYFPGGSIHSDLFVVTTGVAEGAIDLRYPYVATIVIQGSDGDHTFTWDVVDVTTVSTICASSPATACNAALGPIPYVCATSAANGDILELRINDANCTGTAPSINLLLEYR